MGRLIDILDANFTQIQSFVKLGIVPLSLMNDYTIYLSYSSLTEKCKKEKYKIVAEKLKISTHTVRRAVLKMNKKII